jgi:hypothetical protein
MKFGSYIKVQYEKSNDKSLHTKITSMHKEAKKYKRIWTNWEESEFI